MVLIVTIFQGIRAKKTPKILKTAIGMVKVCEPYPIGLWGAAIKNIAQKMMFEVINSTFFTQKTHFKSSLKFFLLFKLDLKWVFTVKKLSFWLQTSLSELNFWLPPLWGQLGLAYPLRLKGVKSADFYPPNSRFPYFFGFVWLGCLEILVLAMPVSLEAIAVKKSPKIPLWNFWTFFFFFFQMAIDRVKMIFQTPNKASHASNIINIWFLMKNRYPKKY